ncbi:tyrosine-type recombinase/integrase [Paraliomyxa miuraensis]|uniref:tyrosine-type recombinase/integrase n=1 Tax=Paraliomyxa miuraensis TaxID=376150 RepID=UPI00224EA4F6|nr:site-specific integrase [Paraliomyxa miuraensis]
MLTFPGRPAIRERRKSPVGSKSAAKRWGEERERQLIDHYTSTEPDDDPRRPSISKKEVPTLAAFIPRYMTGHCEANRLSPATIDQKTSTFQNHLVPALGRRRLDRITAEDIQRFKAERAHLAPSTVNLHLKHLKAVLAVAIEWGVIGAMPTRIKKLKETEPKAHFYDFEDFDRLVLAAERQPTPNSLLVVLLGGEAGLRCGEMSGLRWSDIDFTQNKLTVARAMWRGQEGPTKGRKRRTIPLAARLQPALAQYRGIGDGSVLRSAIGTAPQSDAIRDYLVAAQEAAGFKPKGPHILRHTFCSHLAMAGKPVRAIQKMAGHASITTTERYMHLAPDAERDAIDGLTRPENWRHIGDGTGAVKKLK